MLKKHFICIIFLFSLSFQAQRSAEFNFEKADSIAIHFPNSNYKDAASLAAQLTKTLSDDLSKFRVLYRWIAENISYDPLNKSSKSAKILKNRSAVCIGYSSLLSEMCSAVGLKCETVKGFSKHSADAIGNLPKKPDHAWNVVKLEGKWQLCDVTWAAGFYDERSGKMKKKFSDTYFLLTADKFIYNHFPEETTWQLLDTSVSKVSFSKFPFTYPGFFDSGINELSNKNGIIKLKLKDTLTLEFKSGKAIDSVNIELDGMKKKYSSSFAKLPSGKYRVKQWFDTQGDDDLIIYLDHRAILAYKIKIQK